MDVSNEILSSGTERIRHGFDWTMRRHPSVAAGIAGAAITLAGAYVAVNADHDSENVAGQRPPAAAGAAPAVPPRADGATPPPPGPGAESRPEPAPELPPESPPQSPPQLGPGAAPGIPHPPLSRADAGSAAAAGGDEASGPGQRPAPAPTRASSPQPTSPPGPDCVLRVDLLGNVVKICV
jgi:hypothetical protein